MDECDSYWSMGFRNSHICESISYITFVLNDTNRRIFSLFKYGGVMLMVDDGCCILDVCLCVRVCVCVCVLADGVCSIANGCESVY